MRIKGRKPKVQLPGVEGDDAIAVLDGDTDLAPVDEAEEKHMNLGLVVGGVVAGIVLLILLVAGGLWWYVHAEKVGEEKAAKAEIVGKMKEGRDAVETTKKAIVSFGANFKELVDKCDKEMTGVVNDIKGFLPEELREPAGAFLSLPPTADIAEAIAYTNTLLSAKQPVAEAKPAEAEKKDEAKDEKKDSKDAKLRPIRNLKTLRMPSPPRRRSLPRKRSPPRRRSLPRRRRSLKLRCRWP